jgi:hypothetical protein
VNFVLSEDRHGRPELVEHGANPTTDDGDHRARVHHLDPTHLLEAIEQRGERLPVDALWYPVEGHAHGGLRGRDEIDRDASLLERSEDTGEKARRLPHGERLDVEQRDSAPADHRHDRRIPVFQRRDERPVAVRILGVTELQRDARARHRPEATRVQHLGAHGRELLRFSVPDPADQSRAGHLSRVGAEHPVHVGPDLEPFGVEQVREQGGGCITAAPAEKTGLSSGCPGYEPLGDDHARVADPFIDFLRGSPGANRGVEVAGLLLVARAGVRPHQIASIDPVGGDPGRRHDFQAEAGGGQFPERQHSGTQPRGGLAGEADPVEQPVQLVQKLVDRVERGVLETDLAGQPLMGVSNPVHRLRFVPPEGLVDRRLETVRNLRKCRNDEQNPMIGAELAGPSADDPPTPGAGDRRTAEFEDHPAIGHMGSATARGAENNPFSSRWTHRTFTPLSRVGHTGTLPWPVACGRSLGMSSKPDRRLLALAVRDISFMTLVVLAACLLALL